MKRICRRCGSIVELETDKELCKEYKYHCPECDESKYTFETELLEIPENAMEILFNKKKIIFNSEPDREYEDYICPTCQTIL